MLMLRRRFATCALAMLLGQTAAVFAAPLASCCPSRHAATAATADEPDCCPAGSHPPGQCPRHAGTAKAPANASCRMQCDAPHGVQFLIAVIGMMPAPASSAFALLPGQLVSTPQLVPGLRASIPHSPPPRVG